jgi:hypothetical protein
MSLALPLGSSQARRNMLLERESTMQLVHRVMSKAPLTGSKARRMRSLVPSAETRLRKHKVCNAINNIEVQLQIRF